MWTYYAAYARAHWATHRSKWIAGILAFCVSIALGVLIGLL